MTITSIRISNFRNLASVQIAPALTGLNVISGKNGGGKTSLLEAIFYLGHGKSFRSSSVDTLIKHDSERFSVFSQVVTEGERVVPLGAEREGTGATRLRADEKDVKSITVLAGYLPIRVINSHSHQLLEAGPIFRRKYLDWGLFYQFSDFMQVWRQYERALKQRNAILREKRSRNELEIWTEELIRHGLELDKLRKAYIEALLPQLTKLSETLLGIKCLEISYDSGWDRVESYRSALEQAVNDEYRIGHTQSGPHRADFDLISEGLSLKHILSRGQQKLMICAMILAQGMLLSAQENRGLIYLVDDLPAELDIDSRKKLISLLAQQKTQIFITAIEQETIYDVICDKMDTPMKVFHVEHGSVVELTEKMVQ